MTTRTQKLVVRCFMISVDGIAAGLNQRMDQPFGDNTEGFTDWMFATKAGNEMLGLEGGEENLDNAFVVSSFDNIGAVILGRNMFTTSRGPWTDDGWTGWWGPNPPYHAPTLVLTNHTRDPLPMEGGTTFHFETAGIHEALDRAFALADGKDVRLMGGASTIRQYLNASLIDELHFVVVPMMIGQGERVFDGTTVLRNYVCVEHTASDAVVHVRFERR